MSENPFYRNAPRENSNGVGSAYGTSYRFGFFLEADGPEESNDLYYRIMVGNPDDDILLSEVSCKILASLFADEDEVRIYKYASGPIVIFSGDEIVGIIKDGSTGDVLWDVAVTYTETIDAVVDQADRLAYLTENLFEDRVLLYVLGVNTTSHKLTKLQRKETQYYPYKDFYHSDYSLSLEDGSLFVRTPSMFIIVDNRITIRYDGEEAEQLLQYDPEIPFAKNTIAVEPTGISTDSFVNPDIEISVEPEIVFGQFHSLTIVDGKVVPPVEIAIDPGESYYPTNILSGISETEPFRLYATIEVVPNDSPETDLSQEFSVTIEHIFGEVSLIPTGEPNQLVVQLCSVNKKGNLYYILSNDSFSAIIVGNAVEVKKAIGAATEPGDLSTTFPFRAHDPWAIIFNDSKTAVTIKNAGLSGFDGTWLPADDLIVSGSGYVYGKMTVSDGVGTLTLHQSANHLDTICTPTELEAGTVKVKAFEFGTELINVGEETEATVCSLVRDWIHSGIFVDRAGWEEKQVTIYTTDKTLTAKIKVLASEDTEVLNEVAHAGSEGQVLGLDDGGNLGFINQNAAPDLDVMTSITSIEVTSEGLVFTFGTTNLQTNAAGTDVTKTVALVEKTLVDDVNYAGTAFTKNKTSIKGFAASAADSENESIVSLVSHASQHPE